jgi:hypothetical protein
MEEKAFVNKSKKDVTICLELLRKASVTPQYQLTRSVLLLYPLLTHISQNITKLHQVTSVSKEWIIERSERRKFDSD